MGAVPNEPRWNQPNTLLSEVSLERNLVVKLIRTHLVNLHLRHPKIQQDGLADPLVNDPLTVYLFSDPELTTVQQFDGPMHRIGVRLSAI
jgi:hypothetical protein